jgi:hypothetical protein
MFIMKLKLYYHCEHSFMWWSNSIHTHTHTHKVIMTFFYYILENILVRGSIWNGPCKAGITSHLSQCSFHTLLADIGSIGVGFRYILGELGELGAIVAIGVAGLPTLGAMLNVKLQR